MLYSPGVLDDRVVVGLVVFFRSGFAMLVSDRVMGIRGRRLWVSLVLGGLLYGVPSMMLMDWLGLYSFIGPFFSWSYTVLQEFDIHPWLAGFLGLSLQGLVLDFPRLMLFVAIEWAVALRTL